MVFGGHYQRSDVDMLAIRMSPLRNRTLIAADWIRAWRADEIRCRTFARAQASAFDSDIVTRAISSPLSSSACASLGGHARHLRAGVHRCPRGGQSYRCNDFPRCHAANPSRPFVRRFDQPWLQYFTFLKRLVMSDFGRSFVYNTPVLGLILSRLPTAGNHAGGGDRTTCSAFRWVCMPGTVPTAIWRNRSWRSPCLVSRYPPSGSGLS